VAARVAVAVSLTSWVGIVSLPRATLDLRRHGCSDARRPKKELCISKRRARSSRQPWLLGVIRIIGLQQAMNEAQECIGYLLVFAIADDFA
jgi:hypothetical protein